MKFIWSEPEKDNSSKNLGIAAYPKLWWEKPVKSWLNYNGVWPENGKDYCRIDYNYCYHFFDITIYECWLSGHGNKDQVIKAMINYLHSSNLNWKMHDTFIWDNGKERPGKRFWIIAEDYIK